MASIGGRPARAITDSKYTESSGSLKAADETVGSPFSFQSTQLRGMRRRSLSSPGMLGSSSKTRPGMKGERLIQPVDDRLEQMRVFGQRVVGLLVVGAVPVVEEGNLAPIEHHLEIDAPSMPIHLKAAAR